MKKNKASRNRMGTGAMRRVERSRKIVGGGEKRQQRSRCEGIKTYARCHGAHAPGGRSLAKFSRACSRGKECNSTRARTTMYPAKAKGDEMCRCGCVGGTGGGGGESNDGDEDKIMWGCGEKCEGVVEVWMRADDKVWRSADVIAG